MTIANPRAKLTKTLGLAEHETEWLDGEGYWDDVAAIAERPDSTADDLAALVRDALDRYRAEAPTLGFVTAPQPDREGTLSVLLAGLASDRDDVRAFRSDALGDRLIAWDDLDDWITSHADAPTSWEERPAGSSRREVVQSRRRVLYVSPGSDWVRRVWTTAGGDLERLRVLAGRLATDYRWHEAQASVFILTGLAPKLPAIRVTTADRRSPASRIVLEVDPFATPEEVMRAYREHRHRALTDRRPRRLSERHHALAAWWSHAEHERPDESSTERMSAWNASGIPADWRYRNASHMSRDARLAIGRLLTSPFDPTGATGG